MCKKSVAVSGNLREHWLRHEIQDSEVPPGVRTSNSTAPARPWRSDREDQLFYEESAELVTVLSSLTFPIKT